MLTDITTVSWRLWYVSINLDGIQLLGSHVASHSLLPRYFTFKYKKMKIPITSFGNYRVMSRSLIDFVMSRYFLSKDRVQLSMCKSGPVRKELLSQQLFVCIWNTRKIRVSVFITFLMYLIVTSVSFSVYNKSCLMFCDL